MSLIKRNENPFFGFPKIFEDFFGPELWDWRNSNFSNTNTTIPAVNIRETENNYQLQLAAPGMEKADFNIKLEDNKLIISSAKQQEQETQEAYYTRREFSYQSFQRSFSLPGHAVDEDKIKARYANGLLTVDIPKKEATSRQKPSKEIEID